MHTSITLCIYVNMNEFIYIYIYIYITKIMDFVIVIINMTIGYYNVYD
jgi:hypothetical protein